MHDYVINELLYFFIELTFFFNTTKKITWL